MSRIGYQIPVQSTRCEFGSAEATTYHSLGLLGMGKDVALLADGGVVVIGEIPAGDGSYLGFSLLKLEADGSLVWRRDDFPEYWRATQVLAVSDGILIAAGALIKTDREGEF